MTSVTLRSRFGGEASLAGTMPGYHAGRPPRNKGMRYPAGPPTAEEIGRSCATRPMTVTAGAPEH